MLAILIIGLVLIIAFIVIVVSVNKKSDIGKIYKTTEGFLRGNKRNKEVRRIVVIDQRDDTAIAYSKIYSLEGKEDKLDEGKDFVKDLILKPEDHSSLTEDSIIGNNFKINRNKCGTPVTIYPDELEETNDKVTSEELKTINDSIIKKNKYKKSRKSKIKKWKNHFKK